MTVLVAGSRSLEGPRHYKTVKGYLDGEHVFGNTITEVVSGTARGVDRLGERWAKENEVAVKRFPADWKGLGRRAGHIRNVEMAKYLLEKKGKAFIFWDTVSRGTEGMIDALKRLGIMPYIIEIPFK